MVEKYRMAPVGKDLRVTDILEVNWNPQKIVPNLYEETTSDFNEDTLTVNKNSFKDFFDGGYIFMEDVLDLSITPDSPTTDIFDKE